MGDYREGWAPLILSAKDTKMISKQNLNTIPARTSPGKIRSALFIANQDNNVKMVTDEQNKIKIRRQNTYIVI